MDQEKIGLFLAACRKEQGLTQVQLGEQLGVTDRAVSKWERGRSLPDPSLMLPLCALLGIQVNELLTGERLSSEGYREKAEDHLLELAQREEESNRRLLALETVIGYSCSISFLTLLWAACYAVTSTPWRVGMIVVAVCLFCVGGAQCLHLEQSVGYYECPHCGKRYVPTMRAVLFAPHMFRSRKMRCPFCGNRGYHKKVLTQ